METTEAIIASMPLAIALLPSEWNVQIETLVFFNHVEFPFITGEKNTVSLQKNEVHGGLCKDIILQYIMEQDLEVSFYMMYLYWVDSNHSIIGAAMISPTPH